MDVLKIEYPEDIEQMSPHLLGDTDIEEQLAKLLTSVQKGFQDSVERADGIQDYWDIYNCKLNEHQFYSGNSKVFLPLVHNAVNARKTRFTNQIFPQSKRHVEVLTTDGTLPEAVLSVTEHYIAATKLRTQVMPALCVNGDLEGQYSLYVGWKHLKRSIKRRARVPIDPQSGDIHHQDEDAIISETIVDGLPDVEILTDNDLLIHPATSDSIDDALANGGHVSIIRRWSKAKVEALIDDGTLDEDAAQSLLTKMEDVANKINRRNRKKSQVEGQGIQVSGGKEVEVYETWTNLKIKEEKSSSKSTGPKKKRRPTRKLCQVFMRDDGVFLGCRENPYWNGKCPILSVPVVKIGGSFKGESKVRFCADVQYSANDAVNLAFDSAMYSLNPITMTDPEKNPRVASMVLSMAAIWETSPNDTKIVEFPQLWEQGFSIAGQCRDVVMQVMSVSPAAITQTGQKKKPSQAELANEQQVDLLTTADAVTVLEEGILTPLVQWFIDLDYQYRDRDLQIKQYGKMGMQANIQKVEPLQMQERFEFRWLGVEAARNAQQVQQQIAMMNVVRGVPPQFYPGYSLNLGPAIASMIEAGFGPRLAPLTFMPTADQLSMPPMKENELLVEGFDLDTSPLDNDREHLFNHLAALASLQGAEPATAKLRAHMQKHQSQMAQKQQAMSPQQPGLPGSPGGAGGQPGNPSRGRGLPGQPRQGAMPMRNSTGGQAPPGSIPQQQQNVVRSGREMRGNGA